MLRGAPYVLPLLTAAPSGDDEVRRGLSYLACIREYAQRGWTDWCHVELRAALAAADEGVAEVIPLFSPEFAPEQFGAELADLPADIAKLREKNARRLAGPDLFDKSVQVVHEFIQRRETERREGGS